MLNLNSLIRILSALFIALLLVACSGGSSSTGVSLDAGGAQPTNGSSNGDNTTPTDNTTGTNESLIKPGLAGLEGHWHIIGVNAGDAASGQWNGWFDGGVTIAPGGLLTDYSVQYDDGTVENDPLTNYLAINNNGVISASNEPSLHGALSLDQDMAVFTSGDASEGYTMAILLKSPDSVSMKDFQDLWYMNDLSVGDNPEQWTGWLRGTLNISGDGNVHFDTAASDGYTEVGTSTIQVSDTGALQDPVSLSYVSRDDQIVVGRETKRHGYVLNTLLRAGGEFTPKDIQGSWVFHVLTSGDAPQINSWGYGTMNIDVDGNATINSQTWSNETMLIDLGKLSVDARGSVISSILPGFAGKLSANKDTIVATFNNASGGASLLIGLRRKATTIQIIPQEEKSMSSVITSEGGAIHAASDDGTMFDLNIPANALDRDVKIKITPIKNIEGLPVSGSYLAAAQLSPEGLQLNVPAALTITLPVTTAYAQLVAYVYSGALFHFIPLFPDAVSTTAVAGTSITLPIYHFSSDGVAFGDAPDMSELNGEINWDTSNDADAAASIYENNVAAIVKEIAQYRANGGKWDPKSNDAKSYIVRLRKQFVDWLTTVILPTMRSSDSIEEVRWAVHNWLRWVGEIQGLAPLGIFCEIDALGNCATNLDDVYPGAEEQATDAVDNDITPRINKLEEECNKNCKTVWTYDAAGESHTNLQCDTSNICFKKSPFLKALPWIYLSQILQADALPDLTAHDPEKFCTGIGFELAQEVYIDPSYMGLKTTESDAFSAKSYMKTYLSDSRDPIARWVSENPDVAPVDPDGEVYGNNEGLTQIKGGDSGLCLFDTATVQVDNALDGIWNVWVWSRSNNTCQPAYPTIALPDGQDEVAIRASQGDVEWSVDNPNYFPAHLTMNGTSTRNTAKLFGVDVVQNSSQSCDIEQDYTDVITGTCKYHMLDSILPVHQCSGEWGFKGTRERSGIATN